MATTRKPASTSSRKSLSEPSGAASGASGGGGGRPKRSFFTRFSQWVSTQAGKPTTFIGAMGLIVLWGVSGPLFGFGDTWQLVINTSTTIITFLMVFVIQNSQNRDTAALHIKLDELIASGTSARRILLDLEELDESAIEKIRSEYEELARRAREGR
ncbi:low affinity Fe/Cu permease [Angulomicrobium tetraedrale]|uniref:Low affinity Fe/Cu permease n=1 Tax=Ancylobacter tetraedralis TaxID=217068 RepID=A0A839Z864_9HYPH|nr:low affinity iron permease family protein [Ancylobacter tetraedralis]MBB3770816.1 low affinity Fe/Cu permease [Ancylobacter tetraedralis]